jgi:AraC-like DNA-binding protein
MPAPAALHGLVETAWVAGGEGGGVRVLPDGCMDLIRMGGRVVVAGPDTTALDATLDREPVAGLRFRPGALPRLLGVPAVELRDRRVPLAEVCSAPSHLRLWDLAGELAARPARGQTAPWPLHTVHHVTTRLAAGATVGAVADEVGWSSRTLHRQSVAVYGYGPATLRRILRFRRAAALLRNGVAPVAVAAAAGYADQPHLHRECREFSGLSVACLVYGNGANRSTDVPSGSSTVA